MTRSKIPLVIFAVLLFLIILLAVYPVLTGALELKDIWGDLTGSLIGFILVIGGLFLERYMDRLNEREKERESIMRFAVQYFSSIRKLYAEIKLLPKDQRPRTPFEITGINIIRDRSFSMLGVDYGLLAQYVYAALSELNHVIVAIHELEHFNTPENKKESLMFGSRTGWARTGLVESYGHYLAQFLDGEIVLNELLRRFEDEFKIKRG